MGTGVEAQETGGGGEAEVRETAMIAAEEDPLAVASVGVEGLITLASGRRASKRFTPLSSRRRRTG